jgi:hypothetical protein
MRHGSLFVNDALRPCDPSEPVQMLVSPLSICQVIDRYFTNCSRSQNPRGLAERRRLLGLFCESFGSRLVTDCRPADLVLWLNANTQWQSQWTIKRVLGTVQQPFNWAERLRIIDRNPYRGVSHCETRHPLARAAVDTNSDSSPLPWPWTIWWTDADQSTYVTPVFGGEARAIRLGGIIAACPEVLRVVLQDESGRRVLRLKG